MKRWYNVELFDEVEINSLRLFLFSIGAKFETSGCGKGVHFEIYCNEFTAKMIDDYINT